MSSNRTRPYLVPYRGNDRIVDATSISAATAHVLKPDIDALKAQVGDVRPATASQVATFARGGGNVEIAGVYPEPELTEVPKYEVRDGVIYTTAAYARDNDWTRANLETFGYLVDEEAVAGWTDDQVRDVDVWLCTIARIGQGDRDLAEPPIPDFLPEKTGGSNGAVDRVLGGEREARRKTKA